MKYFRTYPWALQLMLFFVLSFTLLMGATVVIGSLLPRFAGVSPDQLAHISTASSQHLINVALIVQAVSSISVWLLPAFLFAYLAHPAPAGYLGLRAPGKKIQPVLAVLVILGAMPALQLINDLVSRINFSPSVRASQQAGEDMTNALVNTHTFGGLLVVLLVVAVLPAVGEELFFRGVFMRFVKKKTTGMAIPATFTALVFAFAHANVYGFISIFLAGILLAVIYNLTGSLWCSMLAHLFFNGWQIVLAYAGNTNATFKKMLDNPALPYYMVAGGAVLFAVSFYLLLKNKTPLPQNWAEDFSPEELAQEGQR